ncbi:hypothetical protein [Asanoa sp. NPDC050611]|uniref:hypothetical protein n=1 Tax=Asanoa sp. NPDC050611 TaxID=3157098 RepID=UPI0033E921B4
MRLHADGQGSDRAGFQRLARHRRQAVKSTSRVHRVDQNLPQHLVAAIGPAQHAKAAAHHRLGTVSWRPLPPPPHGHAAGKLGRVPGQPVRRTTRGAAEGSLNHDRCYRHTRRRFTSARSDHQPRQQRQQRAATAFAAQVIHLPSQPCHGRVDTLRLV